MIGKRIHGNPAEDWLFNLNPGEYAQTPGGKDWYARTPNGLLANLGAHAVTEHEDGTITVSPSILVTGGGDGPSYHGFLDRGLWRDV